LQLYFTNIQFSGTSYVSKVWCMCQVSKAIGAGKDQPEGAIEHCLEMCLHKTLILWSLCALYNSVKLYHRVLTVEHQVNVCTCFASLSHLTV